MKVEQLMQRAVQTCHTDDTMNRAAQLMWEHDCGCIPVVDDENHPIGMLTDRDVCMAAYTQGTPLSAIRVRTAMARQLRTCRSGDTIGEAESIMRSAQVRRLPVVDAEGALIGILSLNDIAQERMREAGAGRAEVGDQEISTTLGAICAPRRNHELAAA